MRRFLGCALGVLLLSGCELVEVTETLPDGTTRKVRTNPENARRIEEDNQKRQARQAGFRAGPRRKASDPIVVALFDVYVDGTFPESDPGAVNRYLRKEFEGDPVIRLMDPKDLKQAAEDRDHWHKWKGTEIEADVEVHVTATARTELGQNKRTHKIEQVPVMVYSATVTSRYDSAATRKVEDMENIFLNQKLTERFAARIKQIIKDEIGPGLPGRGAGDTPEGPQDADALLKGLKDLLQKGR